MQHNKAQIRELLSNYGPIDMLFLDGEPGGLKELAWEIQPKILVTRGEMVTPEQKMPDAPMPGPWEACFTLGTQWQFKPTNEHYKSGTTLIEMLIEIRAKGGNLLLNIGPQPDGVIPFEQERLLQELALWLFINGEAIYKICPWHVIREGDIWFTKSKDKNTLYAFVTKATWPFGERKEIILKSVRASEGTEVELLGQSGRVLEYQPEIHPKAAWRQEPDGLHVTITRAQRIYNDRTWPNPVVIRITHAEPLR